MTGMLHRLLDKAGFGVRDKFGVDQQDGEEAPAKRLGVGCDSLFSCAGMWL